MSLPRQYLKPGDLFVLLLAILLTAGLFFHAWFKPEGDTVVVRANGRIMLRTTLDRDADYEVPGKLGSSRIEIRQGRARVASDPGPRQICVRQGWVSRAGEAALCLANQISLEISGSGKPFDSLTY